MSRLSAGLGSCLDFGYIASYTCDICTLRKLDKLVRQRLSKGEVVHVDLKAGNNWVRLC
jgi:hypothetical protein